MFNGRGGVNCEFLCTFAADLGLKSIANNIINLKNSLKMNFNQSFLEALKLCTVTAVCAIALYFFYQILYAVMGGNCL